MVIFKFKSYFLKVFLIADWYQSNAIFCRNDAFAPIYQNYHRIYEQYKVFKIPRKIAKNHQETFHLGPPFNTHVIRHGSIDPISVVTYNISHRSDNSLVSELYVLWFPSEFWCGFLQKLSQTLSHFMALQNLPYLNKKTTRKYLKI